MTAQARIPVADTGDLFEMANLYPRTTGLPVTIRAGPRGHARHDVRIKVCRTLGDRMDADNTAVVAVRPAPHLLHGDLDAAILPPVLRWVGINAMALTEYWEGTIDTVEFVGRLRPL